MALNNNTIVDQVKVYGSNDFQQRINEASQNGMAGIVNFLDETNRWGEFEQGLINRIGKVFFTDASWDNPLAFLKQGMLPFGTTVEEIALGLIEDTGYDPNGTDLLKQEPSDVYSAFHEINRKAKYPLTISHQELKNAFLSEFGLNELVARKLTKLVQSDAYDEYRAILNLITDADAKGDMFRVKTSFADAENPSDVELKKLSVKIRTYAKKMALAFTTLYNAKGIPTVSKKEDLVLITTPEVIAALDVSVLADAFNLDRADFASRVIEVDELPEGVYAVLADKSLFVIIDRLFQIEEFRNGANLTTTYFFHHHQVISRSPYAQAVVFGEAEGDSVPVVNVDLTGLTAKFVNEDGETITTVNSEEFSQGNSVAVLDVDAVGTITPGNRNVKLPNVHTTEIVLSDAEGNALRKTSRTYIDRLGKLYVQEGLAAGTVITVDVKSGYVNPSTSEGVSDIKTTVELTVE